MKNLVYFIILILSSTACEDFFLDFNPTPEELAAEEQFRKIFSYAEKIDNDSTSFRKGFLENYIGEGYADTLATLEERHAIAIGKGLKLKQPVIIQLNHMDDIKCKDGLMLDEEEMNYIKIIFQEMTPQFRFKDGKVMKGRLKGILDKLAKKYLPHSSEIINSFILSKLICSVGSIDNLMRKPASTIQLIGSEKALFRHNKSGNACPKYGLLYYTRELQEADKKGKKARQLSNTLAITIKQDYFENFAR